MESPLFACGARRQAELDLVPLHAAETALVPVAPVVPNRNTSDLASKRGIPRNSVPLPHAPPSQSLPHSPLPNPAPDSTLSRLPPTHLLTPVPWPPPPAFPP